MAYIARLMGWWGGPDRWAYRSGVDGQSFGLSEPQIAHVFAGADALINLTGATVLRDDHLRVPVRIYLETDPVLPQIEIAKGRRFTADLFAAHTHHFTFGENFGAVDCAVPIERFTYRPTRQPIVLDWWTTHTAGAHGDAQSPPAGHFTTIASWQQAGKDIEWNGDTYFWSKHREFMKFIDLPRRIAQPLELALACGDDDEEAKRVFADATRLLAAHGWYIVDALALSKDIVPYRGYICRSRGEFTVAKDQNIRLRSGWFSDRSACYLAAGRPVITQDTGFNNILPTGEGLFAFKTMEDIVAAVEAIDAAYARHSRTARAIADHYFRAETVLAHMLDDVGL